MFLIFIICMYIRYLVVFFLCFCFVVYVSTEGYYNIIVSPIYYGLHRVVLKILFVVGG